MEKLILVILLLIALPAQAGEYAVFRGGSHTNVDLCLTDSPSPANGDIWIQFFPTSGDRVIQHYDYSGATLVYAPPPPPPTPIIRDLRGFVMAVRTEPTFNAQIRNEMGKLIGLLQADYTVPQLAQQDWSDAIANPNNAWLTQAVQDKVVSFATTYKIPLTSQIP